MRINENTIIKCNNLEEVKDCLDKLKELGFNVCFNNNKDQLIVNQSRDINSFQNYIWAKFYPENFCVNYKTFIKLYNKQTKEKKQPDLLIDKNGKVLKVNNNKKMYTIYFFDPFGEYIHDTYRTGKALQDGINYASYYISEEACEKAIKRKEIENKLKALAFELNGNKDIDWNDEEYKYYLFYYYNNKTIEEDNWKHLQLQGTIYCYNKDFKDKAIELIGEEDLKDYLINC